MYLNQLDHSTTMSNELQYLVKFQCNMCGKCFGSNAALQMHENIHKGIKPYICTICNKGFNHNSNMLRHMKTVHNKT